MILLAVVLFAALSYAVTQSSRGAGSTSSETNALRAAQLIQYGDQVSFAVMRIMMTGGYDRSEVSFENNGVAVNANCTEDGCKVFHSNGGGVSYWELPVDWRGSHGVWVPLWRWNFSKNNQFYNVRTNCADASCNDVALLYRGIQREVCIEINNKLGIDNPSGEPPEKAGYTDPDYVGSLDYYSGSYIIGSANLADNDAVLNGQYAGCFFDPHPSDIAYHFYRIVMDN